MSERAQRMCFFAGVAAREAANRIAALPAWGGPEIQGIALESLRFQSMSAAAGAPKRGTVRSAVWRTESAAASTEAVLITNLRRRGLPALRLPAGFASTHCCPETGLRVDRQEVGSRHLWQCPA